MSGDEISEPELEIAHILFIDTVGFSKLLMPDQRKLLSDLNDLVRGTDTFRQSEAKDSLVRLPTGDGMALVFADDPEAPVRCALEISRITHGNAALPLRMGIHSGPVSHVTDVNDRANVTGAGINTAQRVMSCGDAGHILLSKRAAEDLDPYPRWHSFLHELGDCEVKHGVHIPVINFFSGEVGNAELPKCVETQRRDTRQREVARRRVGRRKVLVSAGALLAVAAGYGAFRLGTHQPARPPPPLPIPAKSIAVLPFENLTNDAQNTHLADGIMDEILTDLLRISDLKVISRTSSMQYRSGVGRNLKEIAASLGVAKILEGTIQRVEGKVRVSAQLIDAASDAHIWAKHYDMEVSDIFDVESTLAEAIATQLQATLSPQEKASIERPPTNDLKAYELYVQSKDVLAASVYTRGHENREEALRLLESALARDPNFLLALCQCVRVHSELYLLGMDHTPQRLALADAALAKAIKIKPDAGETRLATAIRAYCSLDYTRARSELDAALKLLPNETGVYEFRGFVNRRQSRWPEADADLNQALSLDPLNFYYLQQVSQSDEKLRHFDHMAEMMRRALALIPGDPGARIHLAEAEFFARGDVQPLQQTLDQIVKEDPKMAPAVAVNLVHLSLCRRDFPAAYRAVAQMPQTGGTEESFAFPRAWYAALVARTAGDSARAKSAFVEARAQVEKILEAQPDYPEALALLGLIDAGLGDRERALTEARRAVELLPLSRDSINGALVIQYLAVVCAWVGEKKEALDQLEVVAGIPSDVNYGQLKLHPFWDPLRGDPRFERIVDSLRPK